MLNRILSSNKIITLYVWTGESPFKYDSTTSVATDDLSIDYNAAKLGHQTSVSIDSSKRIVARACSSLIG